MRFENSVYLSKNTRVIVKLDSQSNAVQPGSEGFVVDKLNGSSKVRFYSVPGRFFFDELSIEVADKDIQVLGMEDLLERHQDFHGIAQYFFNDCLLSAMRSRIDASVFAFAADLALNFLVDEGFVKVDGDDVISIRPRILSVLAPEMDKTYQNRGLFSSHCLSAPPSERKPHVLCLELTTGCDYNKCAFCSEYTDIKPLTKSVDEFKKHVNEVVDSIGAEKSRITRLFFGSGNSLGAETRLLYEALTYASDVFNPQRISLYGRTVSILEKSVDELKNLKEAGLSMVYWGLESGSDEVLDYLAKDCTRKDMIEASKMLAEAEIDVSGMIMPGAGGLRLSRQHVAGTLELLNAIEINYLTLLSINPDENSLYARKMKSETDNRHLTPDEVNAQVYTLLKGLKPTGLTIGMFTEEVDSVSNNTMKFNYKFTDSSKDLLLKDILNLIDNQSAKSALI